MRRVSGVLRLIAPWMALVSLGTLSLAASATTPPEPSAANPSPPGATTSDYPFEGLELAPVVVDGRTLFKLRGFTVIPAGQRAREVASRIKAVAADRAIDTRTVTVEAHGEMSIIRAGGQHIVAVTDADAGVEGVERTVVAEVYANAVIEAIESWRTERTPKQLFHRLLYLAGFTLVLLAALYVLRRLLAWTDSTLQRRFAHSVGDVGIQRFRLISGREILRLIFTSLRILMWLAVLAVVYFYIYSALDLFPTTRATAAHLGEMTIRPLRTAAIAVLDALPGLAFLLVLFFITRYALRLIQAFFGAIGQGRVQFANFDPEWSQPTFRIVRLLVLAFVIVVAYPYIPGSGSEAFKGISILLGVMFSLGSTGFISNSIAGYSMQYRRAFRVGDVVRIGDVFGTVTDVRLQVTHIRTPKNEEVVVPNSSILSTSVTNYSTLAKERGLIMHTRVGIGYETPWRQVEAMLLLAASRTPGILAEPAPYVLERELADFAVTYELNVHTNDVSGLQSKYADLHRNILDVFNEYGVQIMTPAYESDTPDPKLVPRDRWYEAPAKPPADEAAPTVPKS